MKKIFPVFFTLFSFIVQGQYTAIPDPNFEQKLIDLGYDNLINGQVLTSIINQVTSLNIPNSNISNLTGIEGFTSLQFLNCSNNPLVICNLTQNTTLSYLIVGGPNFTSLSNFNLNQNIYLQNLHLTNKQSNDIILDLNNTHIVSLTLSNINCDSLTIKNSSNLLNINYYNLSNDPIFISKLVIQNTPNLIDIELKQSYNTNTVSTNTISFDNISFSNVKSLIAANTGLNNIFPSLSQFSNLQYIYLDGCLLSTIDLSNNYNLQRISAKNAINLSNIKICSSFLDSINITDCQNLNCLSFKGFLPQISDYFSLHATGVPNLNCIEVQDGDYFSLLFPSNYPANNIDLDPQIIYSSSCGNSCSFSCSGVGLKEISFDKKLVKIIDYFGRETNKKSNELLFYHYSDGSIEKIILIE